MTSVEDSKEENVSFKKEVGRMGKDLEKESEKCRETKE